MTETRFFFAKQVAAVRRRAQRFCALHATNAALSVAVIIAALAITLDVCAGLPEGARWTTLAVIGACVCAIELRYGMCPARRCSEERALAAIERAHPTLGQRLRTARQVADPCAARTAGFLPCLVEALTDDARSRAVHLAPCVIVPYRRLLPALAVSGVLLVVCGALVLSWGDFRTAVLRLLAPGAGVTFTRLTLRSSAEAVPIGEDVAFEATITGRPVDAALLHLYESDAPCAVVPMTCAGPGLFRAAWKGRGRGCAVFVTAGDGVSARVTVGVYHPPVIASVHARLIFPEYLGRDPLEQEGGDIEAVEGTCAWVTFAVSHPVVEARVKLISGATAAAEIAGNEVRTQLVAARGEDAYRLEARDAAGLALPRVDFLLRGSEDLPPRIEIVTPERDLEATCVAEVPIRFRVTDDFGVASAEVVLGVDGKEMPLLGRTYDGKGSTRIEDEALLMLEQHRLDMRSNVRYYVAARDRNPARHARALSELRSIDIRPFLLEYRLTQGG